MVPFYFFPKKIFFISRNSTYMTKLLVWEHYTGCSHDRPIISSLRSTLEKVPSRSSRSFPIQSNPSQKIEFHLILLWRLGRRNIVTTRQMKNNTTAPYIYSLRGRISLLCLSQLHHDRPHPLVKMSSIPDSIIPHPCQKIEHMYLFHIHPLAA